MYEIEAKYPGAFSTPTIETIERDIMRDVQTLYDAEFVNTENTPLRRSLFLSKVREIKHYDSSIIEIDWDEYRPVSFVFKHGVNTIRRSLA